MNKEQQKILVVLLMFLIGGGYTYWNYLLRPILASIKVDKEKLSDLNAKIENAERQTRRLAAITAERDQLQFELVELEKQLPKDKDLPNIIRTITREALAHNIQFNRFAPRGGSKQQYFEILPFDLQISGTLTSLAQFLASLGQQERIFQAQNIVLSPSSSPEGSSEIILNITLIIQTYAYSG
ncbi:MAG: type 4a pilus biogenesis protein PilO [Elusimicrobiota bacterium]